MASVHSYSVPSQNLSGNYLAFIHFNKSQTVPNHHSKGKFWRIWDWRDGRREKRSTITFLEVCILVIYLTVADTVVHKLGHGASSTVWLARYLSLCQYVTVKIRESGFSKLHHEVDILNNSLKPHPTTLAGFTVLHLFFKGTSGQKVPLADTSLSYFKCLDLASHA